MVEDFDSVRRRIISSVFNRRNAAGGSEETYVSHVKIWEDAGTETDLKPRYILLARMPKHLLCVPDIPIAFPRKSRWQLFYSQVQDEF